RQFVFFVTERGRDFLKERFVASVIVDLAANTSAFLLQPELRGGIENPADAIFRQIFQWRLTTARSRQRKICAKCIRQSRRVNLNLGDVAVGSRRREERSE